MEGKPVRLLDRLREAIRLRHYSLSTERAYCDWVRRFILFHDKRHPQDLWALEVTAFLSHLAVGRMFPVATACAWGQHATRPAPRHWRRGVAGSQCPGFRILPFT
ncbi:phage integrase N-terminal SAM-like domain-containing protein [Sinimarinibacterium flocculans]|uniref:phage integrase N-terminal SAM-like domain-containing protein n=1 Tax=Sinimarinibacterium flocculans TaxID=985250 RepID=UPI003512ABBE